MPRFAMYDITDGSIDQVISGRNAAECDSGDTRFALLLLDENDPENPVGTHRFDDQTQTLVAIPAPAVPDGDTP